MYTIICCFVYVIRYLVNMWCEWVSEWLNLTAFLWTVDSGVHIVNTSRVIINYILESSSSLTSITHNLQAAIYFKENDTKKKHKKWGHPLS